jgi:hypothetical protein
VSIVKLNPISDFSRFVSAAQGGGNPQQQGKRQNRQGQEKEEETPVFEVTDQTVGEAVDAFHADTQTLAQGLQASMDGQGPNLRVTLKDGSGALIRQFTGDEFLKLRDAVSKDGRSRGRILDQKL